MRPEILALALIVGGCNWLFRYGPLRADLTRLRDTGPLARFLAATGPAAIATLFVASVMPEVLGGVQPPLLLGVLAVVAVFAASRSVVLATVAGAAGYGLAVWAEMAGLI